MLLALKQGEAALHTYRQGLSLIEQLVAAEPTNIDRQWDLSVSYNRVGDAQVELGLSMDGLLVYRAALEIRERLAEMHSDNTVLQTDLVVSYWKIARINIDVREDTTETVAILSLGLTLLQRLQQESRLTPEQEGWIGAFQQTLDGLQPPRGLQLTWWSQR
ncbi:hypothetical protein C2W62_09260 [Candidatus Entotheonella serta]|nr:hypothetical protein C2W62_09260 [Candidatus Entotheonella serta]